MNPNTRILILQHYGETPEQNMEITLCPVLVKLMAATPAIVQDRPVKKTMIFFSGEEDPVEFNLNEIDYIQIQSIVGAYTLVDSYE